MNAVHKVFLIWLWWPLKMFKRPQLFYRLKCQGCREARF